MRAPRSLVAHGVVVAGGSLWVAYTPTPWRMISVARVHADIVVVPLVALRQVAVHILEQVRFLWVEYGPLDCLPVLDLGASVFNQVGGDLRCGAAVFGHHREGDSWVLGVPRSPVESPFRRGAGARRHCGRVPLRGPSEVRV